MSASFNSKLSEHLAELKARQARFAAIHPGVGPMELRRSYWGGLACRRRGVTESRRRRTSERKENAALIWLIKESQPFWDE